MATPREKLLNNPAIVSTIRKIMVDLKAEGLPVTQEIVEQEVRERIAFARTMEAYATGTGKDPGELLDSLKAQAENKNQM